MIKKMLCASVSGLLLGLAPLARAQDLTDFTKPHDLSKVRVTAEIRDDHSAYASKAQYGKKGIDLGLLGN